MSCLLLKTVLSNSWIQHECIHHETEISTLLPSPCICLNHPKGPSQCAVDESNVRLNRWQKSETRQLAESGTHQYHIFVDPRSIKFPHCWNKTQHTVTHLLLAHHRGLCLMTQSCHCSNSAQQKNPIPSY